MFQAFEHQDARAFAQHRAVALLGEREAAFGRQHVQRLPGLHGSVRDDAFRRAGDRDIDDAVADVIAGDADRMCCRRTGRAGRECRALDAEFDADVGGRRRADDAQQRQRMRGALVVNEQIAIGRLEGGQPARARTDDAGRAIWILEGEFQARLADCFIGGSGREPRIAVGERNDAVALEVLEARFVIEILDLGRNQDFQIVEREAAERQRRRSCPASCCPTFRRPWCRSALRRRDR